MLLSLFFCLGGYNATFMAIHITQGNIKQNSCNYLTIQCNLGVKAHYGDTFQARKFNFLGTFYIILGAVFFPFHLAF